MEKTFKRGDKVRENRQGAEVLTVLEQRGTSVWFYEINGTIHATKIVAA